jgi:hypothetical protein
MSRNALLVGENAACDGGPVVASKAHEHHPAWNSHCQRKFTNIFGVVDTSMSNTVMQLYT